MNIIVCNLSGEVQNNNVVYSDMNLMTMATESSSLSPNEKTQEPLFSRKAWLSSFLHSHP